MLPWLIEMGIDCINPVEPYSNDIVALKKQYGDRVAFRGNVDLGGVLATGTPEQVYEETKRLVLAVKDGGNYVCSTSHSLTNAIPTDNYFALVRASPRSRRVRGITPYDGRAPGKPVGRRWSACHTGVQTSAEMNPREEEAYGRTRDVGA